ncbi:MAG: P1 family peptidase [Roseiflexaceae bacterium]
MPRLRDIGLAIGTLPTGPHNAITDVAGVEVGYTTIIKDTPHVLRTGVTVILPRGQQSWQTPVPAGYHSFNGCGEVTGVAWMKESGLLYNPIAITGTPLVGSVWDAMCWYSMSHGFNDSFLLPVVAETYDGWLSDRMAGGVGRIEVAQAITNAHGGAIAEGCVGGGTGMICHEFKGGTGTSSRVVMAAGQAYTVGVLVQANYGAREDFRVDGVPVGRAIPVSDIPSGYTAPTHTPGDGSIIVIIATDAPLMASGCDRLAQRATVGLARVGGYGHNKSGDLFVAFSTGHTLRDDATQLERIEVLAPASMNELFHGVADAVEEAILNALCAAETTIGYAGRTAHALPVERMVNIVQRAGFFHTPADVRPRIDHNLP